MRHTSLVKIFWLVLLLGCFGAHAKAPQQRAHANEVDELEQAQRQYQQAIQEINQLNPFSQDYKPDAVTAPQPSAAQAGGKSSGAADQLKSLLSNPAVRGYLQFFQSPAFADGAKSIAQSGNRKTLIWVEVIWFLLMFLSRARSLSRIATSSWGQVIWINLSHMVVLWTGALIAIPWVLFGEPYRKVIWGFFSIVFG